MTPSRFVLIGCDGILVAAAAAGVFHAFRLEIGPGIAATLGCVALAALFIRDRAMHAVAAFFMLSGAILCGLLLMLAMFGVILSSMGGAGKVTARLNADGVSLMMLGAAATLTGLGHLRATKPSPESAAEQAVASKKAARLRPGARRMKLAAKLSFVLGLALGLGWIWLARGNDVSATLPSTVIISAGVCLAISAPLAMVAMVMGSD